jgi:hypothetical protein
MIASLQRQPPEGRDSEPGGRGIALSCSASIACVELFGVRDRSGFVFRTLGYNHCGPLDLRRSRVVVSCNRY